MTLTRFSEDILSLSLFKMTFRFLPQDDQILISHSFSDFFY